MPSPHLGILTGGGDVPGLNAAIKSVYRAAQDRGWLRKGGSDANVTGILRGWKGVVQMSEEPAENGLPSTLALTDEIVRTVDRSGGTFLHSSRTRPDRIRFESLPAGLKRRRGELRLVEGRDDLFDLTDQVIGNLRAAGIDHLVAIGGDDTLGYAHTLNARGFPVVGIPKTMDNDVRGTEYALGFKTALTRADQFINRQRTHLGSHETVGVFRIFGRNAGFTALGTAMAISDIRCLIPEHRFDLESLCRVVDQDYHHNASRYALVLCSEGAIWEGGRIEELGPPDAYGHRKKSHVGESLAEAMTRLTGLPTRPQDITYDLRSGDPDTLDKIVANTFGTLAVELIARGQTARMVCIQNGVYGHAALPDPAHGARTVDVATHYDIARFRPKFSGLLDKPLFF
ncbi:MAG TPA: 6-phosphofructokinase [Candidatus Polarisedimenticolia bacterium]|nr:6-phosphofructokinase [Candidatus Polarisedimenticolia bacterium]